MVYTAASWLGIEDDNNEKIYEGVVATPSNDFWHIDVMIKGDLVENHTIFRDPDVIRNVQHMNDIMKQTRPGRVILDGQLVDTHLMVDEPKKIIPKFSKISDYMSFHIEAMRSDDPIREARDLISLIKSARTYRNLSPKAGIAFNPGTEVKEIVPLLPDLDYVLVMSVVPGKGGQPIQMDESLEKVRYLADYRTQNDLSFLIEMDGGIKVENSQEVIAAGVDILVAGTGIFKTDMDPDLAVRMMKTINAGEKMRDIVPIACDHGAMQVKQDIKDVLLEMGKGYVDMGPPPLESTDFPLYAAKVARLVNMGTYSKGIVSCTSGQGMIEAVSTFPNVRAGLLLNQYHAEMTVKHNAINMMVIPQMKDSDSRMSKDDVREILKVHYRTKPPIKERYTNRVKMISDISRKY